MENEIQTPVIEKSLWATIKGTLQGINNEGSAKRMALFFFSFVLLSSMTAVFNYCFYISVLAPVPTSGQLLVIGMYKEVNFSYQLSCWLFGGLTTIEAVTAMVKTIRGGNDKGTNPDVK